MAASAQNQQHAPPSFSVNPPENPTLPKLCKMVAVGGGPQAALARPEARMLPRAAPRPGPGACHPARSSLRCPLPSHHRACRECHCNECFGTHVVTATLRGPTGPREKCAPSRNTRWARKFKVSPFSQLWFVSFSYLSQGVKNVAPSLFLQKKNKQLNHHQRLFLPTHTRSSLSQRIIAIEY